MKKIVLTDQQYEQLKQLALEMESQDNRATQYPLFVIMVDKKVYGSYEWCDEAERKEESDGELCSSCEKLADEGEELPEYCNNCDSDCFVWFKWEQDFDLEAGVFLTAKACDEHIRLNHYHYTNPRSYGISAWRNYEMQDIMKLIFDMIGLDTPSHYF